MWAWIWKLKRYYLGLTPKACGLWVKGVPWRIQVPRVAEFETWKGTGRHLSPLSPIYTQHRLSVFLVNECGNILKTMTADSAFHYITLQREKGLCCRASSLWLVGTNALGKVDYRENMWVLSCLSQQNQNWGGHMPSRYVLPSLHDLRDSPKPYYTVSQYHHPGEHAFTTWTFGEHLAPML